LLAADLAHIEIDPHTNEAAQRVVRGTVQVRAPVDRDLAGAAGLVRLGEILDRLYSHRQDGAAFVARLIS